MSDDLRTKVARFIDMADKVGLATEAAKLMDRIDSYEQKLGAGKAVTSARNSVQSAWKALQSKAQSKLAAEFKAAIKYDAKEENLDTRWVPSKGGTLYYTTAQAVSIARVHIASIATTADGRTPLERLAALRADAWKLRDAAALKEALMQRWEEHKRYEQELRQRKLARTIPDPGGRGGSEADGGSREPIWLGRPRRAVWYLSPAAASAVGAPTAHPQHP